MTKKFQKNVKTVFDLLVDVPGLCPKNPQGTFYMMVGIDHLKLPKLFSCLEFMRKLAMEQSVFVFPGECFNYCGYFRIVLAAPESILIEACVRIREFCEKYYEK